MEVDITSFASNSSYYSKGAPQKSKSELFPCRLWQMHMALCVFQLFILPVFCWLLNSGAIPSVVVKTRVLNEDFSMSIPLYNQLVIFDVDVFPLAAFVLFRDLSHKNAWLNHTIPSHDDALLCCCEIIPLNQWPFVKLGAYCCVNKTKFNLKYNTLHHVFSDNLKANK